MGVADAPLQGKPMSLRHGSDLAALHRLFKLSERFFGDELLGPRSCTRLTKSPSKPFLR